MQPGAILLVEDFEDDIDLMLRALEKNNIANEVVVARNGREALDYIFAAGKYAGRDAADLPQLILLDIKLPGLSGLEVLRRIRKDARTRRVPIVMLTSSAEERDVAASYDSGANSYVRKPLTFMEFSDAVAQLGLYWLVLNEPAPSQGVGKS